MNLLQIKENKIIPTPEALAIPEFNAIWLDDDKLKKELALRHFAYIYFLCDFNSVYQSYPREKRDEKIRKDLGNGKMFKISRKCKKGVEKYEELQKTFTMEFLESVKSAQNAMTEYFKKVNFAERDVKGQAVYKPTEVTKCMKDAGDIVESLEKLKEKVKTEIYEKDLARGQSEVGHFER